jgi:hypothetical protein
MHHGLHRPPWKRVVLTVVGLVLTVLGIVLWLTPVVTGGFLAYLGIPLLFAASPRHEARIRRWMTYRLNRLRARLRRWERRRAERRRAEAGERGAVDEDRPADERGPVSQRGQGDENT